METRGGRKGSRMGEGKPGMGEREGMRAGKPGLGEREI